MNNIGSWSQNPKWLLVTRLYRVSRKPWTDILLNLSKSYDVINHNRLLDKLDSYGIRGSVNKWCQSYLTNGIQFVEISQIDRSKYVHQHRFQSSSKAISYGIPQGSILGPLLFLIYINDLPLNIQGAKLIVYADDTNVLVIDRMKKPCN